MDCKQRETRKCSGYLKGGFYVDAICEVCRRKNGE